MSCALRLSIGCLLWLVVCGCRLVEPHSVGKSPLAPLMVSPDSISLEIYSAPAPGEAQLAELWQVVDEQHLDPELRKRLAANGLRAGVVGPNVPDALVDLLKITDDKPKQTDNGTLNPTPLDSEGTKTLRVLHARAGKRNEVVLPHTGEEFSLLECVDSEARGKIYHKAECRLALRVFPESDGGLRLQLTPEMHHGEYKSHVRGNGGDGVFMMTNERPKRCFQELTLEPKLGAGQMLVVTRREGLPLSVGHHFFTNTKGDRPVPMLWVFRAARAAPDRVFYDGPTEELEKVANDASE